MEPGQPETGATTPPETGSTDQPETGTNTPPETGEPSAETDWKAEATKWAELARKNETRAKANAEAARELDRLKRQSMSETDRAVAEAVAKAHREAQERFGSRLVDAEVRAVAAGRAVNVDALLEGLDRSRFLTDDGDPDVKGIAAWLDKVAPKVNAENGRQLDLGQGARTAPPAGADMNQLLRRAAGRA